MTHTAVTFLNPDTCLNLKGKGLSIACCEFRNGKISEQVYQAYRVDIPYDFVKMVERRKHAYLAGRLCAHRALSDLGCPAPIQVTRDQQGLPVWPVPYTGSISHSTTRVIACVGTMMCYRSVGVDVEEICTIEVAKELSSQVLVSDEHKLCINMFPFEVYVSLVFSAKESVYKALFPDVGYVFEFHDIMVTNIDSKLITFALKKTLSPYWKAGFLIDVHYNIFQDSVYTCALSVIR